MPVALALGALGVVYGDLGTNPLFALAEAFGGEHGVSPTPQNVLGVLSLIFWALMLVVTLKYLTFVMRASNDGEGGILALLGLIPVKARPHALVLVILFGAALLYGDGVVTPAISVLSAVEGLKGVAPNLSSCDRADHDRHPGRPLHGAAQGDAGDRFRLRTSHGGLVPDHRGARRGADREVPRRPPGARSRATPSATSRTGACSAFSVLGAVILCIAGGEALYADMGHFGRRPIALAWYALVLPSLVVNYFGQGALLLGGGAPDPSAFYAIVPARGLGPDDRPQRGSHGDRLAGTHLAERTRSRTRRCSSASVRA